MKLIISTVIAAAFTIVSPVVANAQVIFDAFDGDAVTSVSNTNGPPGTFSTPTPMTLDRNNAGPSHFASTSDLQTLNGGVSIAATDVVQLTWVVDSVTGDLVTNGIEFGVNESDSFRANNGPVNTLLRLRGNTGANMTLTNANRLGFGFGNIFTGGAQSENIPTEEAMEADADREAPVDGLEDGFTVVQTITATEVTTQFQDIEVSGPGMMTIPEITTLTNITEFPATTDFVSFMNGSHFYAGGQIGDATGGTITMSVAQVELNPVVQGSVLLGDVNQDAVVNFLDIAAFIGVLTATGSFQAEADINEDGMVNFLDIAPFIGVLTSVG